MSSPAKASASEGTSYGPRWATFADAALVPIVAIAIVIAFEWSTNFIDVEQFKWDNVRYMRMADRWFSPETMTSPFAYRWGTPALAKVLSEAFSVSLTLGFRLVAWTGAVAQLVAVFWLVREVFSSSKAGWAGLVVTALSVWNVRFLLFDPYRPDHLAYPIIVLASLAALKQRWGWLLALTLLGAPFREFTVVPLMAVLAMLVTTRNWRTLRWLLLPALATLAASVVLPRALIPITVDNRQTVATATFGDDLMHLLTYGKRHINIVLAYLSYFVPALMLARPSRLRILADRVDRPFRHYLGWYSLLVFALVFMGGTDLNRFLTFMIVPLAVVVGGLALIARPIELIVAVVATFWFNRLGESIPDRSVIEYKNFWGAYSGLINPSTWWRYLWAAACVALGWTTQRLTPFRHRRGRRQRAT